APSGEYLKTGGFMIRGKKNYLTASQLVMGFGLLFRLDSESAARHLEKRCQAEDGLGGEEANCDNLHDEQNKQKKLVTSELSEQSFNSVNSEEFSYPDNETLDAIQCLTGNPTEDDNILFALPVCAPYAALSNYKFKVKLTPGTTKKGKAIKTAIDLFMQDRTALPGLREFIKVIQEQDVARDFPGKVKVSAPNLHSVRKKR
ncbi:hypothetical protein D917_08516, partial [Trichinella nativa]